MSRVQNLGQKAAQLKAAMETAPAKVAAMRETVATTAGQLGQLRADVQAAISDLRAEGEVRLTEALAEIDSNTRVFLDAGYVVHGVEMELGVVHRLIVHLEKADDVPHGVVRQLMAAHGGLKTVQSILAAIVKAEEVADRASLRHLGYHRLTAYVGISPSIRICWASAEAEPAPASAFPAPSHATATLPPASAFTQSTYFERRPPPDPTIPTSGATAQPRPVTPVPPQVQALASPPPKAAAPPQDALARFKKMPDLTKYAR